MTPTYDLQSLLRANRYPGRGIVLGRSADARHTVIAYFILGRSVNSRNRVFVRTDDGIRTEAHDPALLRDPSLIIYHPVRTFCDRVIVTNGDQTDTIRDFLAAGKTFEAALRTRKFEPDVPNYTPRISGLVAPDGRYTLSILKTLDGDPGCCARQFFEYDCPAPGTGHFLHTYQSDGSPLPSFAGEPERVAISAPDAEAFADQLWESLDTENKISLYVQYRDCTRGTAQTVIRNKYGAEAP